MLTTSNLHPYPQGDNHHGSPCLSSQWGGQQVQSSGEVATTPDNPAAFGQLIQQGQSVGAVSRGTQQGQSAGVVNRGGQQGQSAGEAAPLGDVVIVKANITITNVSGER